MGIVLEGDSFGDRAHEVHQFHGAPSRRHGHGPGHGAAAAAAAVADFSSHTRHNPAGESDEKTVKKEKKKKKEHRHKEKDHGYAAAAKSKRDRHDREEKQKKMLSPDALANIGAGDSLPSPAMMGRTMGHPIAHNTTRMAQHMPAPGSRAPPIGAAAQPSSHHRLPNDKPYGASGFGQPSRMMSFDGGSSRPGLTSSSPVPLMSMALGEAISMDPSRMGHRTGPQSVVGALSIASTASTGDVSVALSLDGSQDPTGLLGYSKRYGGGTGGRLTPIGASRDKVVLPQLTKEDRSRHGGSLHNLETTGAERQILLANIPHIATIDPFKNGAVFRGHIPPASPSLSSHHSTKDLSFS